MHGIIFIDNGGLRSDITGYDNIGFRIIVVITTGGDRSIIGVEISGF